MVNTRRMESNGSTSGPRHRTRGSLRLVKVEVAEESGSSSVNESDSEDLTDKESSSNTPEKTKEPIKKKVPLPSRNLRSKFSFTERKYNPRPLRSSHKRLGLNERHSLAVYSSHKMHDDSDDYGNGHESEEEIYSVRSRRSRHLIKMNRIQRRTALSLRPISQKCYTDPHSPLHFNSDSDEGGVRRSKRKKRMNMTWLADNQMHKVGYPNLNAGYSEEDSRDAADAHRDNIEISHRVTRRSNDLKNTKYLYDYGEGEISSRRRRNVSALGSKKEIRPRRESNDKENKKDVIVNGKTNGRLRSSKTESEIKPKANIDENEDESNESEDKVEEDIEEPEVNGVANENGENDIKQEEEHSSDSGDEKVVLASSRPRSTKNRRNSMLRNTNFSSRNGRNGKVLESSSESEEEGRKYSLRNRPPKPAPKTMQTSVLRTHDIRTRRHFTRRRKRTDSTSSSSSSSSSDVRHGSSKTPKNPHSKNEKLKSGGGGSSKIIPIKPETLDSSVRFNSIGGLDSHIQCLKEMILLPMMYPEVFKQFQVQAPRGVLFHGPPGTGKTLIARALANECSFGKRKVSFFLRKGADLLSKWIGESEKQLRLLFEQAAQMKPSIIFFDELDGLAPVRSSRQDQVHASIVSTLLALMDGLDDRGEVIVIGATNRIDAIDPALRRPGRFDRELFFPLPSIREREEILSVHVSLWANPPSKQMLSYLAENTVGYCGSDLRALCSEAVIQSFRRNYPQVYNSEFKLLLDPENVKVEKVDFLRAKSLLVPATHRISQGLGRKLLPILEPILQRPLESTFSILEQTFPHGLNATLAKVKLSPNVRPAQLLITGDGPEHGQTLHLAPAILFRMEHIHSYLLDLPMLFRETGRSPEEACIQVFNEARRNVPSIVYIPSIDQWWELVAETVRAILIAQLQQLDPNIPILFLATADRLYKDLPSELRDIFSHYRNEVMEVEPPNCEIRRFFYKPLIIDSSLRLPRQPRERPKTPPPLLRAPTPPPPPLNEEECRKLYDKEEHTLRELRIFLRDMCKKLASNKLFFMFTKPVDTEEVPDYTTIIKQPMDLETMMTKVDFHRYECAKDFLNDIELICQNALEYNPARTSADKQIRHRACSLRDYAYTLIKTEMDTDFEEKCQEISKKRKERKHCRTKYLPPYINTPEMKLLDAALIDGADKPPSSVETLETVPKEDKPEEKQMVDKHDGGKSPQRKRKRFSWQKGYLMKKRKRRLLDISQSHTEEKASSDDSKENEMEVSPEQTLNSSDITTEPQQEGSRRTSETTAPLTINCDTQPQKMDHILLQSPKRRLSDLLSPSELLDNPLDFDDVDQALNETVSEVSKTKAIECSQPELERVLEQTVKLTEGYSLVPLLDLHNQLSRIIKRYSRTHIRTTLPKELTQELSRFRKQRGLEPPAIQSAQISNLG
ncbi:ATPase family AAA domain-containing protein 2 isoform X1 [Anoplophora glabripennis]|uniref:ATPase family AAA domain-containing protein 2 isoform X1 n=1 Tax=Anoplophora glabripennis TaxID=217634 RepID=UPI000C772320|nr:ATPase family AAA domain-containing protein 2 isoform X1 [Anoplophora glabripennis]XP_023313119.1 ATPase family AAA domain-containing protein 2 isoform X1 [Anoplophora glabripennis]